MSAVNKNDFIRNLLSYAKQHKKLVIIIGALFITLFIGIIIWAMTYAFSDNDTTNDNYSYTPPKDKYPRVTVDGLVVSDACVKLKEVGWRVESVYGNSQDYSKNEISDCKNSTGKVRTVDYYGDSASIYYTIATTDQSAPQNTDSQSSTDTTDIYENPLSHSGEKFTVSGKITSIVEAVQDNTSIGAGFKTYKTMIPCGDDLSSAEFWLQTNDGRKVNVFAESCEADKTLSEGSEVSVHGIIVNETSTDNRYIYLSGNVK